MSGFEVQVDHDQMREIRQDLAELEDKLKRRAVRAGLSRAVGPVKRSMKALVPVRRGALKKSIGHRALNSTQKSNLNIDPDDQALIVGAVRKVGGYAQDFKASLVEFGVPGSTRDVRRNLKGHVNRRRDFKWTTYSYYHPGQRADPFMLPALMRNEQQFTGRFYDGLANYLDRKGLRT